MTHAPSSPAASDPQRTAVAYFDAWVARDTERFGALLDDNATWIGPTTKYTGRAEILAAFDAASSIGIEPVVVRMWADGPDVLTWITVAARNGPSRSIANWMTVHEGVVVRVQTTSDLAASH